MPSDHLTHQELRLRGERLHVARAGAGPLIVFLHGLPRCWYLWRHQLADFARDHLAVAPDQRGYNLSSKPEGDWNYGVWPAVEDVRALVEALGYERFVLVGHDWGGAVAWSFALHYPELLDAVVVLCAPHPALLDRELRENAEYGAKAGYMHGLRDPRAPEIFAADEFAAFRATTDVPFIDETARAVYLESWRQPGAMHAMLAWDRREGLGPATENGVPVRGNYVPELPSLEVQVPALVMYADEDPYYHPGCFAGLERFVADLELREVHGTHWIPEEHPQLLNDSIREFMRSRVSGRRGPSSGR